MPVTFTSQHFNRDPGSVKRAALVGPVFITDRNRPSLVVLPIRDDERLAGKGASLFDLLMPEDGGDIAFVPLRANIVSRPVEFD